MDALIASGQLDGISSNLLAKTYSQVGWYRYTRLRLNPIYNGDRRIMTNYFEMAVKLDADNATYYFQRGVIKRWCGDASGGLKDIRKAISIDESFPEAWLEMVMYPFCDFINDEERLASRKRVERVSEFRPCLNHFDKGYPSVNHRIMTGKDQWIHRVVSSALADRFNPLHFKGKSLEEKIKKDQSVKKGVRLK